MTTLLNNQQRKAAINKRLYFLPDNRVCILLYISTKGKCIVKTRDGKYRKAYYKNLEVHHGL